MPKNKKTMRVTVLEPKTPEAKIVWGKVQPGLKSMGFEFEVSDGISEKALAKKFDIALMLDDDPVAFKKVLAACMVPVAPKKSARQDYNPVAEEGNGFYFEKLDPWQVFASVVRARETFQFPYDWENLLREIGPS